MLSGGIQSEVLENIPINAGVVLHVGGDEPSLLAAYLRRNPRAQLVSVVDDTESGDCQDGPALPFRVVVGSLEDEQTQETLIDVLGGERPDVVVLTGQISRWRDPVAVLRTLSLYLADDAVCVVVSENKQHIRFLGAWLSGQSLRSGGDHTLEDELERNLGPSLIAKIWRSLGWALASLEAVGAKQSLTSGGLQELKPLLERFGLKDDIVLRNLSTRYWLARAVRLRKEPPLRLAALGLRKIAGVTDARVDYPMRALKTLPAVDVKWSSSQLVLPRGQAPGVLVLHRQFMSNPEFNRQMETLAAKGWLLVADMDDDPHHWDAYVNTDFYAFRAVHAVTVSTDKMAVLMGQWNPNVKVFANGIFELPARVNVKRLNDGKIRLFFGALNRSGDWGAIKGQLFSAIASLAGKVEVEVIHDRAFFDAIPDNVAKRFHEIVPHGRYLEILSSCDLAILPLEDTSFNRLKSDLKFIESCACGVVPLCSPVVYADTPKHREIGIFAESPQDWASALLDLCHYPEALELRRSKALDYVSRERMHGHQVEERYYYYKSLLANQVMLEAGRQDRIKHCKKPT